jgi:hypothetical protein
MQETIELLKDCAPEPEPAPVKDSKPNPKV